MLSLFSAIFLGPATVMCDSLSYVFMFLSVATSNMVATALAKGVSFSSCPDACVTLW